MQGSPQFLMHSLQVVLGAHDQLFATLSTRVERWELGGGTGVMLSDTVGFIRRLPHHLIASFKSTLEETTHCQLLLLVLDASDSECAFSTGHSAGDS